MKNTNFLNKLLATFVCLTLVLCCLTVTALAAETNDCEKENCTGTYVNGFCSSCDGYQPVAMNSDGFYEISNGGQLYRFAELVNSGANEYTQDNGQVYNAVLTADIVVNANVLDNKGALVSDADDLRVWTPIGLYTKYNDYVGYTGTFDGKGHTISGLYCSNENSGRGECVGLFGVVNGNSSIDYVGITDTYFRGHQKVGGIVGCIDSGDDILITGCWNDGASVSAKIGYVGGIIGYTLRTCDICLCWNDGAVSADSNFAGGIAGYAGDGTFITGCYNTGKISGKNQVGGIAGSSNGGNLPKSLTQCYNSGTISGVAYVGGIAGQNSSALYNCYNQGDVTATGSNVGGIAGANLTSNANLLNCHNVGTVTSEGSNVGEIAGSNAANSTVDNCYYLADSESDALDGTTAKADFTTGEICYLLNDSTSAGALVWFQTIGEDDYPKFEGEVVCFNEAADPQYYNKPQGAVDGVTRLSGSGRCETAYLAANELKAALGVEKFDAVIIASGDNFADALAGSYLAAVKGAPILLYRNGYAEKNAEYIAANLKDGGTVYILGGTAAVPEEMETALAGYTVKRVKGANRFETNLAILEEAGVGDKDILVATGYNFADSLSASATGMPILLVHNSNTDLTETQKAFLDELDGNNIVVIGGTGAVNEDLYTALEAYGDVERVKGSGREATSVAIAQKYFDAPEAALVAYSRNFPDGLCGGPLAYALGAPLLLTNTGYENITAAYTAEMDVASGFVLGGTAAVSDEIVRTVFAMADDAEITVKR